MEWPDLIFTTSQPTITSVFSPFAKVCTITHRITYPFIIDQENDGICLHLIEHQLLDLLTLSATSYSNIEELGGLIEATTTPAYMEFYVTCNERHKGEMIRLLQGVTRSDTSLPSQRSDFLYTEWLHLSGPQKLSLATIGNIFHHVVDTEWEYDAEKVRNVFSKYIVGGSRYDFVLCPGAGKKYAEPLFLVDLPEVYDVIIKDVVFKAPLGSGLVVSVYFKVKIDSVREELILDIFTEFLNVIFNGRGMAISCWVKRNGSFAVLAVNFDCFSSFLSSELERILEKFGYAILSESEIRRAAGTIRLRAFQLTGESLRFSKFYCQGLVKWRKPGWLIDYLTESYRINGEDIYEFLRVMGENSSVHVAIQGSDTPGFSMSALKAMCIELIYRVKCIQ